MLNDWLRDARVAWRVLARDRAFTIVAVLVPGMGFGIVNLPVRALRQD
ncbi:MAG: hypothetical protein U0163_10465 [Gemmatimonadaceae bacterium]